MGLVDLMMKLLDTVSPLRLQAQDRVDRTRRDDKNGDDEMPTEGKETIENIKRDFVEFIHKNPLLRDYVSIFVVGSLIGKIT